MAVEVSLFFMTQAIANAAYEQPNSFAIVDSSLNMFTYFSLLSFPKYLFTLAWINILSLCVSNRVPSGIPSLYLPVNIPPNNGE